MFDLAEMKSESDLAARVASPKEPAKQRHGLPLTQTDSGTAPCPMWICENDLLSQPGSRQCTPSNLGVTPLSPLHQDNSLLDLSASTRTMNRENTPLVLGLGSMLKTPGRSTGLLDLGFGSAKPSSRQGTPVSLSLSAVHAGSPLDAGFASIPEVHNPVDFATPQVTPLHASFAKYMDRNGLPVGMGVPYGMSPSHFHHLAHPSFENIVEERRAADETMNSAYYAAGAGEGGPEYACEYSGSLSASVAPTPLNLGMFLNTRENTPVHPGAMGLYERAPAPPSDDGEAPSAGSVGHPLSCSIACKYYHKSRGCKDGKNCARCHLCIWTRACER